MQLFKRFKRAISLIAVIALANLQIAPAHASMISNDTLIKQATHELNKTSIMAKLDDASVKQKLIELGVNPEMAKQRVSQMNDAELAQLSQNLDNMPAGEGVLGVVLVVFIVLVITDMLGATDVFPFVKNINK